MKKFSTQNNIYFSGYASVFRTQDIQNDFIMPFSFYITKGSSPQINLLLEHDQSKVIGSAIVSQDDYGLHVNGTVSLASDLGKKVKDLLEKFKINHMSIGYITRNFYIDNGIRHITKAELHEVSLVSKPANKLSRIQNVYVNTSE